ncbi:MAG: hypothetical protein MK116_05815 [Phycisphaerales bacterium]|nr:hypothetical protein [Phycisphaerales bacterium]
MRRVGGVPAPTPEPSLDRESARGSGRDPGRAFARAWAAAAAAARERPAPISIVDGLDAVERDGSLHLAGGVGGGGVILDEDRESTRLERAAERDDGLTGTRSLPKGTERRGSALDVVGVVAEVSSGSVDRPEVAIPSTDAVGPLPYHATRTIRPRTDKSRMALFPAVIFDASVHHVNC